MRCLNQLLNTPLDQLTVAEHGVIALDRAMQGVRRAANEIRLNWWMDCRDMAYHVGYFNGIRLTFLYSLNRRDDVYEELREIADRYASEVKFLSYAYRKKGGTA
jgi:hypothetical protein